VTDRLRTWAYQLAWSVIKVLPESWAQRLFQAIADLVWRRRGRGVLQLEANLARVLGEEATPERLAAVSKLAMRSYLRYWCEAFRIQGWAEGRAVRTFRTPPEHEQLLRDCFARGKGVVMALPHTANWDHAGVWAISVCGRFTTVAERLKPEAVYEKFVAYREALGFEVLPATGGSNPFGVLATRLRAGRLVCLVADRDLTASGVEVDFFGETAKMPAGPALLAMHTGAALLPVTLSYGPGVVNCHIGPEIEVPAEGSRQQRVKLMTQQLADRYAEGIAAAPQDWHMLQPFWVADLDRDRKRAA
jgi:lauroyl/myristoyl acyltransferase